MKHGNNIYRLKEDIRLFQEKLISYQVFIKRVSDTLDLEILEGNQLASIYKSDFIDTISLLGIDLFQNPDDQEKKIVVTSIKEMATKLERDQMQTKFLKSSEIQNLSANDKIEGLKELKERTRIKGINVKAFLGIVRQTMTRIFGLKAKESLYAEDLYFSFDSLKKMSENEDAKFILQSVHFIDECIEKLAKTDQHTLVKKSKYSFANTKFFNDVFKYSSLTIIGGLITFFFFLGKEFGAAKFDAEKNDLVDQARMLRADTAAKKHSIDSMRKAHLSIKAIKSKP